MCTFSANEVKEATYLSTTPREALNLTVGLKLGRYVTFVITGRDGTAKKLQLNNKQ